MHISKPKYRFFYIMRLSTFGYHSSQTWWSCLETNHYILFSLIYWQLWLIQCTKCNSFIIWIYLQFDWCIFAINDKLLICYSFFHFIHLPSWLYNQSKLKIVVFIKTGNYSFLSLRGLTFDHCSCISNMLPYFFGQQDMINDRIKCTSFITKKVVAKLHFYLWII